jgi:hypothetical protein
MHDPDNCVLQYYCCRLVAAQVSAAEPISLFVWLVAGAGLF